MYAEIHSVAQDSSRTSPGKTTWVWASNPEFSVYETTESDDDPRQLKVVAEFDYVYNEGTVSENIIHRRLTLHLTSTDIGNIIRAAAERDLLPRELGDGVRVALQQLEDALAEFGFRPSRLLASD